jgi:hypothetical protein
MRPPNQADIVFDVVGEPEAFIDHMLAAISDKFNPRYIFAVGPEDDVLRFGAMIQQKNDLLPEKWMGYKPALELKDGSTQPYCFASQDCAENFITTVYRKNRPVDQEGEPWFGRVGVLVMLNQQGREQFLHRVVGECAPYGLKTYRVTTALAVPGAAHAMTICHSFPGYEGVPESVDLNARQEAASELSAIPDAAMYGKVLELARLTRCPMGYAYTAMVAATSVFVEPHSNVRPSIFVGHIGKVHSGKTLAAERAFLLTGLSHPELGSREKLIDDGCPASDRGLFKIFPDEIASRLLYEDEGRGLMSKANIQGSVLIPVLNKLFNANNAGVADKVGHVKLKVRLSLLLNFTVKNSSEFATIFSNATAHGFWDRFLYGARGNEKWSYSPWDFSLERDLVDIKPSSAHVPGTIFNVAHDWAAAGEDRDRLAEIALRVALITTTVSQETAVSREALDAALCLMEWQEKIRTEFQPAKGSSEAEDCVKTVMDTFTKANGYSFNWREMNRKHRWYEKFPRTLKMTKQNLVNDKLIGFDKESGRHYLTEVKEENK